MSDERFIRTEERRAFPRWPAEFHVVCGDTSSGDTAKVVEVSEAGLVFSSQISYPVGTEIDLLYRVHASDAEPIKVKAIVRRSDPGKAALEYLNLRIADRLKLLEFGIAQLSATVAGPEQTLDRRQGAIRSVKERRKIDVPPPPGSPVRSGLDRRAGDRRSTGRP